MKNQDEDRINIKTNFNQYYTPFKYSNINKKHVVDIKLILSFVFFLIIFLVILKSVNGDEKKLDNSKQDKLFLHKLKLILESNEILENEMMNKHTTFQLGGPAKYFTKPNSINKIIKILQLCKEFNIDYFILGNGSNLLVSDHGFNGLIINILENNFSDLKVEYYDDNHNKIIVGGGMLMRNLAKKMCLLSLSGLEDIIDIPGTIGGGIIMNASAGGKGLIYDSLEKVKVITPKGEIKELSKIDCQLRNRGSMLKDLKYIVIEATFNLIKDDKIVIQKTMADHTSLRYSRQPMYFPSAGCFFVWMKPKFGSLYDKYKENNLVSYKIGDAMIYTYNIAFIVNLGNAKSSDVYEIVLHVEKIMKIKYNLNIKREVVLLGSFP